MPVDGDTLPVNWTLFIEPATLSAEAKQNTWVLSFLGVTGTGDKGKLMNEAEEGQVTVSALGASAETKRMRS
jgi:hypothetical protein